MGHPSAESGPVQSSGPLHIAATVRRLFANLVDVGFDQFIGNRAVVGRLREAIRTGHLPPALILSGARGAGKYTLALMLAKTLACLERPDQAEGASAVTLPDFCGRCRNCLRIAESENLPQRVADAVEAREALRDADKRETRILIQTHPDVLVIPPDPPQLLIKIGQVRTVVERLHRLPAESQRSLAIFTSSSFMKEAANSLLKILEEPPDYARILLLTENPGELLPTIRSRARVYHLGALPAAEIASILEEKRPEWKPKERELVAHLANGAVGQALNFKLDEYMASRHDALVILRTAAAAGANDPDLATLFRTTETYRAGASGQEKTLALLRTSTGILEDLLLLQSGAAGLVRNIDLIDELERIAETIDIAWIEAAARGVVEVEQGMRRNLLRSLSLDAFALELARRAGMARAAR